MKQNPKKRHENEATENDTSFVPENGHILTPKKIEKIDCNTLISQRKFKPVV